MFIYAHFIGGVVSCNLPFLIVIFAGWFFARLELLNKTGLVAFAKIVIEIFLPVYFFIQVCRSTSVELLQTNGLVIISEIIYTAISFIIGWLYVSITKMDVRHSNTFIIAVATNEIKILHTQLVNSFCYHLDSKTVEEEDYCNHSEANNFVHMFFQGIFLWYVAYYMIRRDRRCERIITVVGGDVYMVHEECEKEELAPLENKHYIMDTEGAHLGRNENKKENSNEKNDEFASVIRKPSRTKTDEWNRKKQIYRLYKDHQKGKTSNTLYATSSFFNKIFPYYKDHHKLTTKPAWKKLLYILLKAPLIAMFTGFVVGFITVIKEWIFYKDGAQFVYLLTLDVL